MTFRSAAMSNAPGHVGSVGHCGRGLRHGETVCFTLVAFLQLEVSLQDRKTALLHKQFHPHVLILTLASMRIPGFGMVIMSLADTDYPGQPVRGK